VLLSNSLLRVLSPILLRPHRSPGQVRAPSTNMLLQHPSEPTAVDDLRSNYVMA
jgi:hypothetical protein